MRFRRETGAFEHNRRTIGSIATKSLAIEWNSTCAGNDLDILEPQRLAAARPQCRIFDRASGGAFAEHDLRPCGLRQPVVTPFLKREIGRKKIASFLGQNVFVSPGVFGQRHPRHDAGIDQFLQPGAQDIGSDPEIIFELVEAFHAVIGLAQDQDGPAVADNLHGARHGTFLVCKTASLHTGHSSFTPNSAHTILSGILRMSSAPFGVSDQAACPGSASRLGDDLGLQRTPMRDERARFA